jgi:hypothetical protein
VDSNRSRGGKTTLPYWTITRNPTPLPVFSSLPELSGSQFYVSMLRVLLSLRCLACVSADPARIHGQKYLLRANRADLGRRWWLRATSVSLCCDDNAKLGPDSQHPLPIATTLSCTLFRLDRPVYQSVVPPTHLASASLRLTENFEQSHRKGFATYRMRLMRRRKLDRLNGRYRFGGFQRMRQVRESKRPPVRPHRSRADPRSVLTGRYGEAARPYGWKG